MAQFLMAKFLSQALQWKARFPASQFYGGLRYEPFIYEKARKVFPSYHKLYPDDKEFTQKFVRDLRNRDATLLKVINPEILTEEQATLNIQFEQQAQLEQQLVAQTNPQQVSQPFSLSALPRIGSPPSGTVLQVPRIPSGITSFGQNLGSSTQIGLKKGLGKVGSGLGSIFGSVARGGGGLLVKAGGFGADALARASNQYSRGSLITGPSKRVWLGAVVGFLILFFLIAGISGQPFSAPTGEAAPTAPIPVGIGSTAPLAQLPGGSLLPGIATDCPISNGTVTCGSQFTPVNNCGHCSIGYPAWATAAYCGYAGTKYALDIAGSDFQSIYLPKIEGKIVNWTYQGEEAGRLEAIQKYTGSVNTGATYQTYYLQLHHTQIGSGNRNASKSGDEGGRICGGGCNERHTHIQLGNGGSSAGTTGWVDAAQYFCRK